MAGLSTYCHPSLGLGNIAQPEVVDILDGIRACEAKIDAAHDKLEAAMLSKRSLTMTLNELSGMGIETASLSENIARLDSTLSEGANAYVAVKIESEAAISALKEKLADIPSTQMPESPIDMKASELTAYPFSSESLKLDSRYFAFDGNLQEDELASIEKFVRVSAGNIRSGPDDVSRSVCDQISDQVENHDVCGTLIITVSCTHRNVQLFSPLVLDPDKAVLAWNSLKKDKIDTSDIKHLQCNLSDGSPDGIPVITGAVYGSGFIGMAHLLRTQSNTMGDLDNLKQQLERKLLTGGWLANKSGEIGVDGALMDEVRAFLSANSISCHVSIIATGAIPTIKSNEMAMCSYRLAENGKDLPLSVPNDTETVRSESENARQNALLQTIRNKRIDSILHAVAKSDESKNKALNLNSLVEALDNYISQIGDTDCAAGIPVSFYIRRITRAEIVKCWLKRYYIENPSEKE